tara:strand:- start:599 stop:1474 length:876 start_codon:yes stop_codon:yes gene_type:complete
MQYNNKNINIQELHPSANRITSASYMIINNVLKFKFTGDCYAMQFEYFGNALLERLLDYQWNIYSQNNMVLIFTTTKNIFLPTEIFNIKGEFGIRNCYCVDVFGNSVQAKGKKITEGTDVVNLSDSFIDKMSTGYIQNKDAKDESIFRYNGNCKIIPKGTFKENQIKQFAKTRQERMEGKQLKGREIDVVKRDRARSVLSDKLIQQRFARGITNSWLDINQMETLIDTAFQVDIEPYKQREIVEQTLDLVRNEQMIVEEAVVASTMAVDRFETAVVIVEYVSAFRLEKEKK